MSQSLKCQDLHGYLKTLPEKTLDRLYNHPATCLAVFRELPLIARHYVMRILFVEQPVSQGVIDSWINSSHQNEHTSALKVLTELRVWQGQGLAGGMSGSMLNSTFRQNLKIALLGGGESWTGAGSLNPDKHAKDVAFLDNYARERWECVLHFMVGSREGVSGVSRDVIDVLLHAGLMKLEENSTEPFITPGGFQFLLMDTASQIWFFMLQYLNTAEARGMDLVETLSFLFQLSFSTTGKDYSTDGMSENQQRFLQHLREFGLVYQRKRKSQRYYPTQLAINLASGLNEERRDTKAEGYIVIETNFRMYAYTNSSLQIALLALFAEMQYRFPNMSVCLLTRDSVREALSHGITAEQIITFLRSHAHQECAKMRPIIPPTVSDQIRLWELERDRFQFTKGVLYNQFLSQRDFELLRDYARDSGYLIWENSQKRHMVVASEGHDDVKKYWKRQKNS